MPNEIDSQLLALVNRFEGVCLAEALRPGTLEELVPSRANVLREPSLQEMLLPVQVGCIVLGRLVAGSGLSCATYERIVERFTVSDIKGLSELAKSLPRQMSEQTMKRAAHLGRLFASGGDVKIDAEVHRNVLANPPSHVAVQHVALALSAAIGTTLRACGLRAEEAAQIITSAHRGVLEGQVVRATER